MPQMSPLSWVLLFLMFITTYTANTIKTYYLKSEKSKNSLTSSNLNQKNKMIDWKW